MTEMTQTKPETLKTESPVAVFLFCSLLIFIMAVSIFASDAYVPALPRIVTYFATSATAVKLTISSYFLGLALSQLIYGPLSDAHGRKPIILTGLSIAIVGSIICLFAPNIYVLLIGRLIQGCGAGAALTLPRSIARDHYSGVRLAEIASYLSMAFGLAPVIAPLVGSYLQHFFDWRSIFLFITLYMVAVFIVIWFVLKESHRELNAEAIKIKPIINNYKILITSPAFISNAICSSIATAGIIVYYVLTPFLFQDILKVTVVEYGWLTVLITVAMLFGKLVNVILAKQLNVHFMVILGCALLPCGGFAMLIFGLLHILNLADVMLPFVLFVMGTGLIFSNAMAIAFQPFRKMAGAAASLYGFIQIITTVIVSAIAAHIHTHDQLAFAILLTIFGVIALSVQLFFYKRTLAAV